MTAQARELVVATARQLSARSLSHGSTGNVSLRIDDRIVVTPSGAGLGTVLPEELSIIDLHGNHLDGPRPSKESFLHAVMLRSRPQATAVVHTHSTHAAAVSCLSDVDEQDAIPPLTAYFVMRVGGLPLLPYFAPGDTALTDAAAAAARDHSALLLRNHGPIAAATGLDAAREAIEEIEETAKIFLLLRGLATRPLTTGQRHRLG